MKAEIFRRPSINGSDQEMREFPVVYFKGGRTLATTYEPILLKERLISLPVRVEMAREADQLMLWGRTGEANLLLERWLNAVEGIRNHEIIRRFAERELLRGNVWTTFQLLRHVSRLETSVSERFESAAMQTFAGLGLLKLFDDQDSPRGKPS